MTEHSIHLTEDERHLFVDRDLPAERMRELASHLAGCPACADDVSRIERFMMTVHGTPAGGTAAFPADDLWPSIRARIEEGKLESLAPSTRDAGQRRARRIPLMRTLVAALAAAVLVVATPIVYRAVRRTAPGAVTSAIAPVSENANSNANVNASANVPPLSAVADSERVYEQEAQLLLNRLELERAMLRPETVRSIDHDLRVIDQAIAELKAAIARDPRNPALHQLLASSYRQKAELLKRVANAG